MPCLSQTIWSFLVWLFVCLFACLRFLIEHLLWSWQIRRLILMISRNPGHNLFLPELLLPGKSQFHFLMRYSIFFLGHFKFSLLCMLQYGNDWITVRGPGPHIPMWLIATACGRSPYWICNLMPLMWWCQVHKMLQIVGLFSYFSGSLEACPIVFESRRKFSLPLKPLAVLANKSPSKTGLREHSSALCHVLCTSWWEEEELGGRRDV